MSTNDRKAKAQAAAKGASGGANVIVVAGIVVVLAMGLIIGGVIWASRDTGSAGGASQLPDGVNWGGLLNPQTREADTARLEEILTTGEVPQDLVSAQ